MDFLVVVKTKTGELYYGGMIKATSIDDADIVAFFIWKGLENDGFTDLMVEALLPMELNQNLFPIKENDLVMYLSYYCLLYDGKFDGRSLNKTLKYFEEREEYEKCSFLFKKMNEEIVLV